MRRTLRRARARAQEPSSACGCGPLRVDRMTFRACRETLEPPFSVWSPRNGEGRGDDMKVRGMLLGLTGAVIGWLEPSNDDAAHPVARAGRESGRDEDVAGS